VPDKDATPTLANCKDPGETDKKGQEATLRAAGDSLRQELDKQITDDLVKTNQGLMTARREQTRLLEALGDESDFSKSLLDTAQVIVLLLDRDAKISYFNSYFEALTGYSLDEGKGRDWVATFLPERDRVRFRDLFDLAILDIPMKGNINTVLTKGGSEREIEWSAKTLKDAAGEILGLLCSGVDVTELKKTENWFQTLVGSVQDALVSIDGQGRIDMFNPAAERMFGYLRGEVAGKPVTLLMPEPYASEHHGYIERYERTRGPHAIGRIRTVSGKRKDGTNFPIELSVTEVSTHNETHYAAFIRDISEKSRMANQLRESERLAAIGTTAAKIGHEIANPLNGLYLNAQLLEQRLARQEPPPSEIVVKVAGSMRREILRLNRLLQDFRSLGRQEKYDMQPVLLSDLIEEIAEVEKAQWEAKGIGYRQRLPGDMSPQSVDRDKLKQALLNVLKNAAEAMPGGGFLTIEASNDEDATVIEIGDTGAGISPDIDVFEPFVTTKPQGTGLGLMIARQIVAAHGGSMTCTTHPGKGTTFRISLPRK